MSEKGKEPAASNAAVWTRQIINLKPSPTGSAPGHGPGRYKGKLLNLCVATQAFPSSTSEPAGLDMKIKKYTELQV